MLPIRNVQFSKLLKVDGRFKEFNFRKSGIEEKVIFNVDVTDDRNIRIYFRMRKEDSAWKILPQEVPTWISSNEANLCDLIEKELQLV